MLAGTRLDKLAVAGRLGRNYSGDVQLAGADGKVLVLSLLGRRVLLQNPADV